MAAVSHFEPENGYGLYMGDAESNPLIMENQLEEAIRYREPMFRTPMPEQHWSENPGLYTPSMMQRDEAVLQSREIDRLAPQNPLTQEMEHLSQPMRDITKVDPYTDVYTPFNVQAGVSGRTRAGSYRANPPRY